MSYFSSSSLAGYQGNYAGKTQQEALVKTTVSAEQANANLFINSRDRNTGGLVTDRKFQPYNDFVLQKGFPILQGQIDSLKVTEVRFPMPPNITTYNNRLAFYKFDSNGDISGAVTPIIISPGNYTGTQLAVTLTSALMSAGFTPSTTVTYTSDGRFQIQANLTGLGGIGVVPYTLGQPIPATVQGWITLYANLPPSQMGLIWTMGFNNYVSSSFLIPANPTPAVNNTYVFGQAPMTYTDYIDITSDVLTQYQELTDTSTDSTNPNHIICRLYIANETSTASTDASGSPVLPGTIYTMIHRQFVNPKVIRWNGQNSIDRIDIRLYDDQGRPLYLLPNSANDFQMSFRAVEL